MGWMPVQINNECTSKHANPGLANDVSRILSGRTRIDFEAFDARLQASHTSVSRNR